jgi:hypothetical protein
MNLDSTHFVRWSTYLADAEVVLVEFTHAGARHCRVEAEALKRSRDEEETLRSRDGEAALKRSRP